MRNAHRGVSDRFARIPDRLRQRRILGEITSDEFAVMVELVGRADWRTRSATFSTIEVLRFDLGWDRAHQRRDESHLRKCLGRLRDLGEIDYESRRGMRHGWLIRLVPGDYFEAQYGSSSDVRSDAPTSHQPAPRDGEEGSVSREHRADAGRAEETRRDAVIDKQETKRAGGVGSLLTNEHLLPFMGYFGEASPSADSLQTALRLIVGPPPLPPNLVQEAVEDFKHEMTEPGVLVAAPDESLVSILQKYRKRLR